MDTNTDVYIGERIRDWRLRRGLSQQVLADRVGIPRSLVTMYERGTRTVDSRTRLYDIATALHVSLGDLTGLEDERLNPNVINFHMAVPRIEAALMCQGNLDLPHELAPVAQLVAAADNALKVRAETDYSSLGAILPDLITGLYQHTQRGGDDEAAAWGGLAKVLFATSLATKGLGHASLAWTAAEAACRAANQTGAAADIAAGAYVRAQVMLATPGAVGASLAYTTQVIDSLTRTEVADSDGQQMLGFLHLHAGLTQAALGAYPADHLDAVDELVGQTGAGTAYEMNFGPANIGVWRMSMALEQREGARAIREAARFDPRVIDTADRQSRFYIELGRAQFMVGDSRGAQTSILRAEVIAPQQTRTRSTVKELVGSMYRQARSELSKSDLGKLAQRVNAVPA